ncbi:MAG: hypothetical protein ACRCV9_17750 [Burkholderiaceae bacterium]
MTTGGVIAQIAFERQVSHRGHPNSDPECLLLAGCMNSRLGQIADLGHTCVA